MQAVHIWSDIACPWCYVGKKRLEQAADELGVELSVEWHSFQLDPRAVRSDDSRDYVQRLAEKYSVPRSQSEKMVQQMTSTGREHGIEFVFETAVPANTFDAHRLLHWAKGKSLESQTSLKTALFDAHFTYGRDLNDANALLGVVSGVGLDVDEATGVLQSEAFAAEVREDIESARELGVSGVPFFVIGKYGVGGAQSPETFVRVLEKAQSDAEEEAEVATHEGAFCGPEGC